MRKTVLITGAAGGIGSAVAEAFARNGYNIVLNYLTAHERVKALAHELSDFGIKALTIKADISDIEQVRSMVDESKRNPGFIDVLVNNAGVAQQKLFTEITQEDYNRIFDVNVRGTFNCCQCVLPAMIARHSGKIINVSSMWGVSGASCEVHYSAAKAAVIGLTKALAKEVGPSNVQVNAVAPGVIDTKMNAALDKEVLQSLSQDTPLCRIGTPGEVAELIYFLSSDKSDFITGQVISVDGGFTV
jgi:3-oxoacyl-[acyl-carrier protein] reductase